MNWKGVHALVQRAKTGAPVAFDDLDALVRPFLLGLAHRLLAPLWPRHSVSDIHQETRLRAWRKLHLFRGGTDDGQTGAQLRAWLAQLMRSIASSRPNTEPGLPQGRFTAF